MLRKCSGVWTVMAGGFKIPPQTSLAHILATATTILLRLWFLNWETHQIPMSVSSYAAFSLPRIIKFARPDTGPLNVPWSTIWKIFRLLVPTGSRTYVYTYPTSFTTTNKSTFQITNLFGEKNHENFFRQLACTRFTRHQDPKQPRQRDRQCIYQDLSQTYIHL